MPSRAARSRWAVLVGRPPPGRDIGFALIQLLERVGLVWKVQTLDTLPPREGIVPVAPASMAAAAAAASGGRALNP